MKEFVGYRMYGYGGLAVPKQVYKQLVDIARGHDYLTGEMLTKLYKVNYCGRYFLIKPDSRDRVGILENKKRIEEFEMFMIYRNDEHGDNKNTIVSADIEQNEFFLNKSYYWASKSNETFLMFDSRNWRYQLTPFPEEATKIRVSDVEKLGFDVNQMVRFEDIADFRTFYGMEDVRDKGDSGLFAKGKINKQNAKNKKKLFSNRQDSVQLQLIKDQEIDEKVELGEWLIF